MFAPASRNLSASKTCFSRTQPTCVLPVRRKAPTTAAASEVAVQVEQACVAELVDPEAYESLVATADAVVIGAADCAGLRWLRSTRAPIPFAVALILLNMTQ